MRIPSTPTLTPDRKPKDRQCSLGLDLGDRLRFTCRRFGDVAIVDCEAAGFLHCCRT
jgi:hypothetical protein